MYTDDDVAMVSCDDCGGWVHAACDGLSGGDLEAIERGSHAVWGVRYACALCRSRAMAGVLAGLAAEDRGGHFGAPVTPALATGYLSVISSPCDLLSPVDRLWLPNADSPCSDSAAPRLESQPASFEPLRRLVREEEGSSHRESPMRLSAR